MSKTVGVGPRWGAAVSAILMLIGCGARGGGGSTGSETHWLQSCDADSDCGEYSCYCGVCTRRCEDSEQCEEESNPDGQCVTLDRVADRPACTGDVPARICVAENSVVLGADGGDTAATSNGIDATSVVSSSSPSTSDTSQPPLQTEICDGSDDVRLWTQTTVGGLTGPAQMFAGAYGWAYLAIDGKCNYWAATSGQLFTGTITDETVLRDYEASYFGKLARFAEFEPGPTCPDAPAAFLADSSALLRINYCGAEDPPADYEETWDAVNALIYMLVLQGKRSTGPLRIAFSRAESAAQAWPLELDPGEWAPENVDYALLTAPDGGIWVNAGDAAETLRAAGEGNYTYEGTSGPTYVNLFVRDELPPKVIAALVGGLSNSFQPDTLGMACDDALDCSTRLICLHPGDPESDEGTCSVCIPPNETGQDRACQSNDDCCGGLPCCVDCGEKSGTCIADLDPCETCIANGGTWNLTYGACSQAQCEPDVSCYTQGCPGSCASDNCEGCARAEECWAAGPTCQWNESEGCYALPPTP